MGSCHWTDFFTALAQLDRALDYESGGWEFESLRWCHFFVGDWCSGSTGDFESLGTSSILVSPARYSLCSSKVEHPADNRETLDRYHPQGPVDNKLEMLYNRFFTQELSMKHAKP